MQEEINLKELYTTASAAVGKLDAPVEKLESKGGGGSQKSLLHYKNMTVNVLEKMDQWRTWKTDVEDYTEETLPGIGGYLEKAKEGARKSKKWMSTQLRGSKERCCGGSGRGTQRAMRERRYPVSLTETVERLGGNCTCNLSLPL